MKKLDRSAIVLLTALLASFAVIGVNNYLSKAEKAAGIEECLAKNRLIEQERLLQKKRRLEQQATVGASPTSIAGEKQGNGRATGRRLAQEALKRPDWMDVVESGDTDGWEHVEDAEGRERYIERLDKECDALMGELPIWYTKEARQESLFLHLAGTIAPLVAYLGITRWLAWVVRRE